MSFDTVRLAALVAALLSFPPVAAPLCAATGDNEKLEKLAVVDEQLAALLASKESDDRVVAGLAALGSALGARVVAHARPTAELPGGRTFTEHEWKRIEVALERLPRSASARALEPALDADNQPATALVGLRLLRVVGSSEQADLFTSLLTELGVGTVRTGTIADIATSTAAAIQTRDRNFSRALAARRNSMPTAWLLPIARALAVGNGGEDLEFVWSALGRGNVGEQALLAFVGQIATRYAGRVDETHLQLLRNKLRAVDVTVVELAAVALGRLGDDESAEQFVTFMTQANPRVRAAGHWGLRELSGLPTGPRPEIWEAWLTESRAWWKKRGPRLHDEMRWESPEVVRMRIIEMASQRLRRRELVAALSYVFERDEEELVDLAIRCMGELRYGGTRRYLVELLEHPSARVQGRAWRALRELTGFDAGPDPKGWKLALDL